MEMSAKSEIDYLANYIMKNVPGEPSQSEGAGHCAVRIIKNLLEELEIANMRISSQDKLIESIEEHMGVDDRGNSIWVQSSNNNRKPCCTCGDNPCTCPF
jgi:hypothetical protein